MWLVAICANGAKVKINKVLLLLVEIAKISTEIKNQAISFLYEEFKIKGRFGKVINNENKKNKAIVV
jgi:hypothetical protein